MTNYHWQAVSRGPSGPVKVYYKPIRKDGKHLVTYCYHRRIRKLITADELAELKANDGFSVIRH